MITRFVSKISIPKFASSAIKYAATNFLNAIVPILLLPLLTNYLSKEDYGLLSIFQVMVMVLLPFIGLNSQGAVEREFFNNRYDFKQYLSNALFVLLISGGFVLLITIFFNNYLSSLTEFPSRLLWLLPVYCFSHNICELLLSFWRVSDRPTAYGVFRVSRTLVEIALSVLLVTVALRGWEGRMEAMVSAAFIFSGIAAFFFLRANTIVIKWNSEYIKDILKFGIPLIPHTLGGIVMVYSDRIFITKMVGLADTGIYTVGYQVAMAISLLQSSFNLAWVPWLYGKLSLNDHAMNIKIVKITYWYFLAILICVAGLTLFTPIIFRFFINQSYHDSIQFVFWIALAFAFDGMYKMVVNYIFYLKKTYIISLITILIAALNLVLNYFFITWYGAIGAAKATTLCMFFEFCLVWLISSRIYSMPWTFRKNTVNLF